MVGEGFKETRCIDGVWRISAAEDEKGKVEVEFAGEGVGTGVRGRFAGTSLVGLLTSLLTLRESSGDDCVACNLSDEGRFLEGDGASTGVMARLLDAGRLEGVDGELFS